MYDLRGERMADWLEDVTFLSQSNCSARRKTEGAKFSSSGQILETCRIGLHIFLNPTRNFMREGFYILGVQKILGIFGIAEKCDLQENRWHLSANQHIEWRLLDPEILNFPKFILVKSCQKCGVDVIGKSR